MSGALTNETSAAGPEAQIRSPSRLLKLWRRFSRNKLAVFGLGIIVAMILTAVLAPF